MTKGIDDVAMPKIFKDAARFKGRKNRFNSDSFAKIEPIPKRGEYVLNCVSSARSVKSTSMKGLTDGKRKSIIQL